MEEYHSLLIWNYNQLQPIITHVRTFNLLEIHGTVLTKYEMITRSVSSSGSVNRNQIYVGSDETRYGNNNFKLFAQRPIRF